MKRNVLIFMLLTLLIVGFDSSFSGLNSYRSDYEVHFIGDNFCYIFRYLGDYSVLESCSYNVDDHFSGCNLSIHRVNDSWVLNSSYDSTKCSNVVERNFTLNGSKVWVFKIVLYEPAKLLNFLGINYFFRATRTVIGHRHFTTSISLLNGSKDLIFAIADKQIIYPSNIHPLFYHSNNYTVDNLKMVLDKGSILDIPASGYISAPWVFDEGVYYIVVGSQAYTLNSSDYDVFYNVSFVFPENYSMSIEVYKQADPIGVSFSEMNASYVYWDLYDTLFGEGGKTVFIDGDVVLKSDHLLLFDTWYPPPYMPNAGLGWYDLTIAGGRYIGFGLHPIVIRIPSYFPPWIMVYNGRSLHIRLSYGTIGWKDYQVTPTSIAAFDIELK